MAQVISPDRSSEGGAGAASVFQSRRSRRLRESRRRRAHEKDGAGIEPWTDLVRGSSLYLLFSRSFRRPCATGTASRMAKGYGYAPRKIALLTKINR
jgi:hypothetical protein